MSLSVALLRESLYCICKAMADDMEHELNHPCLSQAFILLLVKSVVMVFRPAGKSIE